MSEPYTCACGRRATCLNREGGSEEWGFGCDECCDHTGHDGECMPLERASAPSPQQQ